MATFSQFQDEFLVAAFDLSERTGKEVVKAGEIFAKYPLTQRSNWIMRALFDFKDRGLVKNTFTHDGELEQSVWLTAAGMREAERLHESGIVIFNADDFSQDESAGVSSLEKPNEANAFQAGAFQADAFQVGNVSPIVVDHAPGADRIVRFDHNQPEYVEIADGLTSVREAVRELNDSSVDPDERQRILASFDAAQVLWKSLDLKVIQLKVGILMTLEDAARILGNTAKAVVAALLVDTFKAFVKNHVGIDLDAI